MTNKVVYTLARGFVALGAVALRFNFRGVGASEGSHDSGVGEVQDAIAVAAWLRGRWPGIGLYLGGFSFGAAVAVRAAASIQPSALVTVALPFERLVDDDNSLSLPWLLIHGSEDEIIKVDSLIGWLNRQPPGPELEIVSGADHFFHGKLAELRSGVEAFFGPLVAAQADHD
jgi:alpha/beta superfamily hydrolase